MKRKTKIGIYLSLAIIILAIITILIIYIPTYLETGCLKTNEGCIFAKALESRDINMCKNTMPWEKWNCTYNYRNRIMLGEQDRKQSEGRLSKEDCDFYQQEYFKLNKIFPTFWPESGIKIETDFCYKRIRQ